MFPADLLKDYIVFIYVTTLWCLKARKYHLTGIVCIMQAGFSVPKSLKNESFSENQEQPSPISVLEPLFDEDDHSIPEFYNNLKPAENGNELLLTNEDLLLYFPASCLFTSLICVNQEQSFLRVLLNQT